MHTSIDFDRLKFRLNNSNLQTAFFGFTEATFQDSIYGFHQLTIPFLTLENGPYNTLSDQKHQFCQFQIELTKKGMSASRHVTTITMLLSYLGGVFGSLMGVFGIIVDVYQVPSFTIDTVKTSFSY